jgi:hypothetical protein
MRIKIVVTLLCSLAATASIAVLGLQAPASAAPAQGPPVTPQCAWDEFSASTHNVFAPDSVRTRSQGKGGLK